MRKIGLLVCLCGVLLSPVTTATENVMYAWFGDVDQNNPDFIAVIDFDRHSKRYGQLIGTSPLRGPNAFGNEPHHVGLIAKTNLLVAGGLLSLLNGQDEVFFFDVSNPVKPVYKHSFDVPESSATDEIIGLPNGNILVTMMGGDGGGKPGHLAEFDQDGHLLQIWPKNPPRDGFNPHGVSIRPERNLMVTTDFVVPASTYGGPIVIQNKVRVWNLYRREIIKTINLPDAGGTMDIQLIPKDPYARAVVPGQGGQLWLIDTKAGTAGGIFDFRHLDGQGATPTPHIVKFNHDGRRMFVSLYGSGSIAMFDSSKPADMKLLSVVHLGKKAGPHYMRLTGDGRRLVVTDYFLNQHHSGGLVEADGDRRINVLNVSKEAIVLDPKFRFSGNTAFATGRARPHGVVFNFTKQKPGLTLH